MNDRNKGLELRMYFFVPYQLTGMQKGIQAGHAALEYAKNFGDTEEYINFVENHKTWVILNGGTTNNSYEICTGNPYGSLNQIGEELINNNIKFSYFHEPDLNNALTAICLIVDERVFNRLDYPDFENYIENIPLGNDNEHANIDGLYQDWLNLIGGDKNKILRDLINNKKLA